MASKLALYNTALTVYLGERKLASLSENRAPRRRLDAAWDGGAILECLDAGLWNFAMRTVELTYSPSVAPGFDGTYHCTFDKPEDWVKTALVSDDPSFCNLELDYIDEAQYFWAHSEKLYVKYVSKDAAYGLDLSLWPPSFTDYAAALLASKVARPTTGSTSDAETLDAKVEKKLRIARSRDAMNEQVKKPPSGSWVRSRSGGSLSRERGSRSRLIG